MSIESTLIAAQSAANALMTDACTVARADGDPVFNEDTGRYEGNSTTLYAGKCRVRSRRGQGTTRDAGEQFAIVNRVDIWLPVGLQGFATGDLVAITDARFNPQLVNAKYRVRSVDDQSHASALRLECEEA